MAKKKKHRRPTDEVNASSMADIAFLLLIFFLVTTTIINEKGLIFNLPKKIDKNNIEEDKIEDQNMFTVILNSNNQLLVENKPMDVARLKMETKRFLNNNGKNPNLSESPQDAVVSFKADRGADFSNYLTVLNELKAAYHELRADYLDISIEEYLKLDITKEEDKALWREAKSAFPPSISEAEPIDFGK